MLLMIHRLDARLAGCQHLLELYCKHPSAGYNSRMAGKKKSEIQELSEFIRDHMATKEDIRDLKGDIVRLGEQVTSIESEIRGMKRAQARIPRRRPGRRRSSARAAHDAIGRNVSKISKREVACACRRAEIAGRTLV